MIVHLCTRDELEAARAAGARHAPSLDDVGFVHCSDPGTVHLPASRLHPGRTDLVVLEIDPACLDVEVRWEPGVAASGPEDPAAPWFPHVYGPVPMAAVVAVHPLVPEPDGTFRPPPGVRSRGAGPTGV